MTGKTSAKFTDKPQTLPLPRTKRDVRRVAEDIAGLALLWLIVLVAILFLWAYLTNESGSGGDSSYNYACAVGDFCPEPDDFGDNFRGPSRGKG